MMSRMWALGVFALGASVLAIPLEGTVDGDLTGHLRTPEGTEVSRREGWGPEEVLDLGEGRAVVLWRSLPRRNYLQVELWAPSEGGYRRTWPEEEGEATWYQGEARLRPNGTAREVLVSHAVVEDNFQAPLLRRHRVYRVVGERLELAGERVAKPLTPAQQANLKALRAAEAASEAEPTVPGDGEDRGARTRSALARSQAPGAARDPALRKELRGLAGRHDAAGKAAAAALLRLALEPDDTMESSHR